MYRILKTGSPLLLIVLLCLSSPLMASEIAVTKTAVNMADSPFSQWLWVDTKHKKISVMDKGAPIKVFNDAAFGRGGIGAKHKRGDKITPKGLYKIGWQNENSKFRAFIGLTYPSIQDAESGLKDRVISDTEYQSIVTAHQENTIPPQNTALGGSVGIHGIGPGSLAVHQNFNWTAGCIALTNSQIDELIRIVKVGMFVLID